MALKLSITDRFGHESEYWRVIPHPDPKTSSGMVMISCFKNQEAAVAGKTPVLSLAVPLREKGIVKDEHYEVLPYSEIGDPTLSQAVAAFYGMVKTKKIRCQAVEIDFALAEDC